MNQETVHPKAEEQVMDKVTQDREAYRQLNLLHSKLRVRSGDFHPDARDTRDDMDKRASEAGKFVLEHQDIVESHARDEMESTPSQRRAA